MTTDEDWRVSSLLEMTWVLRWLPQATRGLIDGAAALGLMRSKKPPHGKLAGDCLRRVNLSYRAIFASGTDRVTQPNPELGECGLMHATTDNAAGLATNADFSELHGPAIQHQ